MDTQWWTTQPQKGLSDLDEFLDKAKDSAEFELAWGEKVPFKAVDALLVIFGTNSAANPKKIEGIKVDAKAQSIYFVHMTGWENVGAPSYKFVMNYQDGSKQELLMESHVNSDDWCAIPPSLSDKNTAVLWKEGATTCGTVDLLVTKWSNPSADKAIKTIDFVSLETAAVPALFAITLGGASAAVAPGDKLATMWSYLKAEHENP
ncbi:MAG: beta-galactosidase [Candidatus Poribacteria bacterium]|nr:beta-galactosidase [Candidatus Poribacteria bacterium]